MYAMRQLRGLLCNRYGEVDVKVSRMGHGQCVRITANSLATTLKYDITIVLCVSYHAYV